MKHIFLLILLCSVVSVLPVWAEIESHDLNFGTKAFYVMSDDDTVKGYAVSIPFLGHSIEMSFSDSLTLSIDSGLEFYLSKVESDEEAWNSLDLSTEPEIEFAVTDTVSVTPSMYLYFSNYKWDEDTRENWMQFGFSASASYSTMEEDLAGISAWEQFKRGLTLKVFYAQDLYMKDAGEKAEELDRRIGAEAEYAFFNEAAAFMLTPSFNVVKHLNDAVSEALDINAAVLAAKDLSTMLTGEAGVGLFMEKPDADTDMQSELRLGAAVHLNVIEKLEITGSIEYANNMSDDEAEPAFAAGLGVEYELWSY